ncbi:MAG: 4-hydroxy-tetrahydrodipicolinate synthase [Gammaproteobacteria bacterium]|mgnify:FL=1|jgi:4-hydroxy-tetrahydrodipicolinate synthase|nr:4-hydroxy-tetrahydrodipicolinate synthase [Gammaproteobacteria bacterium]MBT3489503.1 4-hydroxy-tetrahydrodipicolinate synthase [Gammaproteobacteria bacterium]MBT3719761.1 4-hydroxy-tetrahydrodipicolinate synthase [Gammaproteobacteria bacterium]MBT3844262.1 4-hydroxy-tetrahydrodipicolinate synthase [Gammaproteobacteria bacterium]MBT3894064.1 4-hydroxy-tetrahydrodipicolinate synthase [Gammaproteobacteria bacterium]
MFQGSMVALVTPMDADGGLDWEALDQLVEFHIEEGTDAIIAMGTTGESATLNEREHCEVIHRVVQRAAGRIPVIAGTGANATQEAIDLTRCAKEQGADAALLVTPYYNKPTQEGLFLHYKAVAETVDIPQILYNVPGRTACDLLPETIGRLSNIANIIGVKEATGDLSRIEPIRQLCHEGFELYSGDDSTCTDFILQGGDGTISVTANVAPKQMHEMCMAAAAGDTEKAHGLNELLKPLHRDLFLEANPIPVKWALLEMGRIKQGIRLPLTALSETYRPALRDALIAAGLIEETV